MKPMLNRRQYIVQSAALASSLAAAAPAPSRFTKSICSVIFPGETPLPEKFRQAKAAGFDGIELRIGDEIPLAMPIDEMKRIGESAKNAGIAIASMWVSQPLSQNPLNSADPAARARGVDAIRKSIDFAAAAGCGALLLYPGRLGSGARFDVGYETTWNRFSAELAKLVPAAEQAKVFLTPENVWNKFLLSPLEMRAFVDQFKSPWFQTHFDMGNVMQFGYPQDWILTLGPRIQRVHVKDYKLSNRAEQGKFVGLFEGDVDFKAVMSAFVQVGYRGFLSPEIGHDPSDPEQLRKVSQQLDRILALAPA